MSLKSKNLEFEATQPAFLRRLRGEARGDVDADGRHLDVSSSSAGRLASRNAAAGGVPKRLQAGDEDEDAPVFVVEGTGEMLSRVEYERLVNGTEDGDRKGSEDAKDLGDLVGKEEGMKKVQRIAEVGQASKKRKAVRIGDDEDKESAEKALQQPSDKKASAAKKKKAKVKGAGVKLSFDDEG